MYCLTGRLTFWKGICKRSSKTIWIVTVFSRTLEQPSRGRHLLYRHRTNLWLERISFNTRLWTIQVTIFISKSMIIAKNRWLLITCLIRNRLNKGSRNRVRTVWTKYHIIRRKIYRSKVAIRLFSWTFGSPIFTGKKFISGT